MEIHCKECNMYLGEILQGSKLHKKIVILCNQCMEKYKTFESLVEYNKGSYRPSDNMDAVKDLFGDVFKTK